MFFSAGTDRNNILGLADRRDNYPLPIEDERSFIQKSTLKWAALVPQNLIATWTPDDVAVMMASSGYYRCVGAAKCGGHSVQGKASMNDLLNNAPASFEGVVLKIQKGNYNYMCSRNNNFSNRSQKGTINVT